MRIFTVSLVVLASALILSACSSSEPEQRPERDPQVFFQRMDKDQDGRISWDEFRDMPSRMGSPEERFQRIDKDADGYITLDEFSAAQEEFRGRGGERRGHGSGMQGGRPGGGGF